MKLDRGLGNGKILQKRNSEISLKTAISRKIKNFVKNYCFLQKINVYYSCWAMLLTEQRLDNMKNQNKIYLPLKKQGIKKAWDKVAIFRTKEDTGYKCLQMVVYWQGKPFAYWSVEDAFNVQDLKLTLDCMLDYYGSLALNNRANSKRITKYFVKFQAAEKVASYKRGGVLFPEV
jgi:hypothetical protein